jgi:hypothetical protein
MGVKPFSFRGTACFLYRHEEIRILFPVLLARARMADKEKRKIIERRI